MRQTSLTSPELMVALLWVGGEMRGRSFPQPLWSLALRYPDAPASLQYVYTVNSCIQQTGTAALLASGDAHPQAWLFARVRCSSCSQGMPICVSLKLSGQSAVTPTGRRAHPSGSSNFQ